MRKSETKHENPFPKNTHQIAADRREMRDRLSLVRGQHVNHLPVGRLGARENEAHHVRALAVGRPVQRRRAVDRVAVGALGAKLVAQHTQQAEIEVLDGVERGRIGAERALLDLEADDVAHEVALMGGGDDERTGGCAVAALAVDGATSDPTGRGERSRLQG